MPKAHGRHPGREKPPSKTTPRRSIPANTSPAEAEAAMVGSDVPPGGPGAAPGSPEHSRKRKGVAATAEEDAAAASASTRRATRSSASALVDGAMAWARRAAAGALCGRNRGIVDDDEKLAVMLALRHMRSEVDPDAPYSKVSILSWLRRGVFSSSTRSSSWDLRRRGSPGD
ncbi:uncharacterized protein [Setaria viridis]|uniref:uncharacterized protein n=1 Tax=Setaria viridis TaxID=4556 RepID=UPI003B3BEA6A